MKLVGLSGAILGVLLLLLVPASAQPPSVLAFKCIAWGAVAPNCANGGLSLEGNSNSTGLTAGTLVSVAGYRAPADGGTGDFVVLGTQGSGSSAVCNGYGPNNAAGTVGSTIISNFGTPSPAGLTVGELVAGSGSNSNGTFQVQPGSEIASITIQNQQIASITVTLPIAGTAPIGTNVQFTNLTIVGSNGGTLLLDSASPKDCYQKTNYRGDPHEFGAVGDGQTNDTIAIQNWLGAYGNVFSGAPSAAPNNFGPWHATIPGTYLVDTPLFCPPNATIEGDENLTNNGGTKAANPRIEFKATNGFSGTAYQSSTGATTYTGSQAVIGALDFCRLSGIAVTGNGFDLPTTGNTHGTTTIDNLGSVSGIAIGNAVVASDMASETVVTAVNPTACTAPCVTISQASEGGGTTGETINFYGPDAVDVLGTRLTIDGFSLFRNGHYDLFCGVAPQLGAIGVSVKDAEFENALLDGIHIPGSCSNVRLIGDIVAGAGQDGIFFGATEADIEGGVIEESNNAGLHVQGAARAAIAAGWRSDRADRR